MNEDLINQKDLALAQKCVECSVCRTAREKQRGFFFWLVKMVEGSLCPYCRAYERVYGKKAHEAIAENSA